MSEITKASYMDSVREFSSRVSMGFYNNSSEEIGEVCINRAGWSLFEGDENNLPRVTAPADDIFYVKKNQVLTYGMPIDKYAVLDGYTYPDGTAKIVDGSPSGIMGLWGDVCSEVVRGADGTADYGAPDSGTFPAGREPELTVLYSEPRTLNQVLVQGCKMWRQFPVDYDVIIYKSEAPAARLLRSASLPPVAIDSEGHRVVGAEGADGESVTLTYSVSGGRAIEQMLSFVYADGQAQTVRFQKMVLKIRKWSHAGAVVKLNYFSRDKNILLESADVKSIDVFEEKSSSVDKLSYGITSNSCTVLALDSSGRFSSNRDLLRRNKLVEPYIALKTNGAAEAADYLPLGKFYSETWEMDSKSKFVRCKAYDILYGLQDLMLTFPLDGSLADGFRLKQNISAAAAFAYVFDKINEEKHNREMYGMDLVYRIDSALNAVTIPYLVLDNQSAWDTLQDLASFTLSNVYVARNGDVIVSCDIPIDGDVSSLTAQAEGCKITPDNSFSYSMPVQSKTIVNKVTIPYKKLVPENTAEDIIEIKREDAEELKNEAGETVGLRFTVPLKYFYKEITNVDIKIEGQSIKIVKIETFYNYIEFEIAPIEIVNSNVEITAPGRFVFQDDSLTYENLANQKANGINEFAMDTNSLLIGRDAAGRIRDRLIAKYGAGVNYTETDWIGSPRLELGSVVPCQNKYEPGEKPFECLCNEIKIDGGLRMRSKLRQVKTSGG